MKRTVILLLLCAILLSACAAPDFSACITPNVRAWSLLSGPMYDATIATMKAATSERQEPAAYAALMQNLDAEIAAMQKRREDAAFIHTPECLEPARGALVEAIDLSILSLQGLRDGDMDSFYAHSDLAAGRIIESMELSKQVFDVME